MATIALYANKINQMPGMIKEVKQTVGDYKSEISALNRKTLTINKSVCNLDDVINSIQTSTQIQEQKMASLDTFKKNSENFISDVIRIDSKVADVVKRHKDDFYDKYNYLKPEYEKNGWEKFKDGFKAVGEWCKEHWKLVVAIALVIVAVAIIILCPASAVLLLGIAKGIIIGAVSGGLLGGLTSFANGDSFWEGFENGAFLGALTGALFGGLSGAGRMLGKFLGTSCKILSVLKYTAKISGTLSIVMGGFDLISLFARINDPSNPLSAFNKKLHSSKLYNIAQIYISALAVFSAGAYLGMKSNNPACFIAGTMILTGTGLVAIEKIKAGDSVVSTDADTFETAEKQVLETYIRKVDKLVHLTISEELITTTIDHPFYIKNHGFVNAGELRVGNEVINSYGDIFIVKEIKIEIEKNPVTVYNFQVEDFHTYHVGNVGVLVHNADYAPRKPIKGVIDTEYHEDGSITYTKKINGQKVKVTYNSDGYPDFSPYAHPDYPDPVQIKYSGNRSTDYARANQQVCLESTPKGYTWHHMEDGTSMLLVNELVHSTKFGFSHTGGFSINKIK